MPSARLSPASCPTGAICATGLRSELSCPELTKSRSDELIVSHRFGDETIDLRKLVQAVHGLRRNVCVVKRRVARNQSGNQRRLFRWEQTLPDRRGKRRIGLQRLLGLPDGAHSAGDGLRLLRDQSIGRRQGRKVIPARSGRSVAAPQIEMQFSDTAFFRNRNAHAVAPKCVGDALLDGVGAAAASPLFVFARGWNGYDPDLIPLEFYARLRQQIEQAQTRALRRR